MNSLQRLARLEFENEQRKDMNAAFLKLEEAKEGLERFIRDDIQCYRDCREISKYYINCFKSNRILSKISHKFSSSKIHLNIIF